MYFSASLLLDINPLVSLILRYRVWMANSRCKECGEKADCTYDYTFSLKTESKTLIQIDYCSILKFVEIWYAKMEEMVSSKYGKTHDFFSVPLAQRMKKAI